MASICVSVENLNKNFIYINNLLDKIDVDMFHEF